MENLSPDAPPTDGKQPSDPGRRRLRAVLAADVANFGGLVSIDETQTLDTLLVTRQIACEELAANHGWLFGMPGDGIFALFESAVDAVRCALGVLTRLSADPKLDTMRLRIGVHLGEVLFRDNIPFGETLVIAARLESLAEPGGILVSASVMEAVAPRISASFCERGVFSLKHSPRRIPAFSVSPLPSPGAPGADATGPAPLDRTMLSAPNEGPVSTSRALPVAAAPRSGARPSLPKAAPLVVREDGPDHAPPPAPPSDETHRSTAAQADAALRADCLAELTRALTMHLGPIARILVGKHASRAADPQELVDALAAEIPAKAERLQFLVRARELLARQQG